MKKLAYMIFIPGLFKILASTSLSAALLVSFTFDDSGGEFFNGPDFVAPGISSASPWSTSGTLRDFEGLSGNAIAHNGNHTFQFEIVVEAGQVLELETVHFWARRSASGSPDWTLLVDGDLVLGETEMTSSTQGHHVQPASLTGGPVDALQGTLVFELQTANASSAQGTFRVDDFMIYGTVSPIPEPGLSGLLLGLAVAALAVVRRKRNPDQPLPGASS